MTRTHAVQNRLREHQLRQMLLAKRNGLMATIRQTRGDLREGAVERASESLGDAANRPALTPEAAITYEVMDRRVRVLAQVDLALKRLEEGTYGRCEVCDEAIPLRRLQALPFAVRCTRCQEDLERHGTR